VIYLIDGYCCTNDELVTAICTLVVRCEMDDDRGARDALTTLILVIEENRRWNG